MEPQALYKDSVTTVKDLMRDTYGDYFKQYYDGDPVEMLETQLPCMSFQEINADMEAGPTGADDTNEAVLITVILNKRDDLGANDSADMTEKRLRNLVKGRDAVTKQYAKGTILHALRTNLTLGGDVIDSSVRVEYDRNVRGDNLLTSEAYITLNLTQRIYVENRS